MRATVADYIKQVLQMNDANIAARTLLRNRFEIEKLIRQYFWSIGFIEVKTPLLVKSPGMEPHIKPLEVKSHKPVFLPTSPEFGMKKLIADGLTNIFQICSSFRDEPESPEHHPEFTMLEFYESHVTLDQFKKRVEELFRHVCNEIHKKDYFTYRGKKISVQSPWPVYRIPDLFESYANIDLRTHQSPQQLAKVCKQHHIDASETESWNDLFFKLWLNLVEPKLPQDEVFFVTHYPVSQSSLCNKIRDEKSFEWAARFEIFAGRLELGNAFDELRDPIIQRKNFLEDQKTRRDTYQGQYPESPIDEDFLAALPKMPPTCGIAIGLDRLCMLILDAPDINSVLSLKSYWS